MSQFLEFEGKSIDKALEKASNELDKPVEDLEYDVVSYGSSGIFGLVGVKNAKIRIKKLSRAQAASDTKSRARDLVKDAFQLEDDEPEVAATAQNKSVAPQQVENMENAIAVGEEALKQLVDFITTGAEISTDIKEQRLIFKVEGGNSGLLIGKRGQTLEAMQYLVEKIVNKKNDKRVRVLVDVEGYLKTRKTNLQKMASRMAEKAKKSNKPVTIGQMNAYDRRTVHMHLKNNAGVRTQSVGEGYYRKLIIFPKKKKRQNRQYN
ncbi:MAG: RNA-binding cell elongation regulator Jag/EloR [Desulfobacteraceae bacterium]|jgi:spoIIIJ-associated protein